MSFTLDSIIMAYCLPILISVSVEYQSPKPRPPTLRSPMSSISFLFLLCVALGAAPGSAGAGYDAVLAGSGGVVEVCVETSTGILVVFGCWLPVEFGWGPLCATAGMASVTLSIDEIAAARARDFMGPSESGAALEPRRIHPHAGRSPFD